MMIYPCHTRSDIPYYHSIRRNNIICVYTYIDIYRHIPYLLTICQENSYTKDKEDYRSKVLDIE
jgi:hypothetical protein